MKKTKVTLTIDKEVVEVTKKYAEDKGQSLSDIVENYLKLVTAKTREVNPEQLSPRVRRLRGIIKTDNL